jgi:putative ABC transport system substrate-binding protein
MIGRRRALVAATSIAVGTTSARAQTRRLPRLGILAPERPPFAAYNVLLQALRALGQIEGETYALETHWAEGQNSDLYRQYANELVGKSVDIILTGDTPGTIAAAQTTRTTPIVMAFLGAGDPIELGLAQSLARPGGNVTGIFSQTSVLSGKRLELLRELLPSARRVAVLHVKTEISRRLAGAHDEPARTLAFESRRFEIDGADEFAASFAAARDWGADAVVLVQSAVFYRNAAKLAAIALQHRLPVLSGETGYAAAGGLMNQGPDIVDCWRRAATYVAKILKGAKPADLPIEQPTRFGLVVNAKAAKALGIAIPDSILARADEVIE